jgi:membrane protein DedA with SNARE-associated domain
VADLTRITLDLLRLYGPLALCLFTFLESSMLFPFLPSEVVIPAAAALLVTDATSLLVFVVAASLGGVVGAFVPFLVFSDRGLAGSQRLSQWLHVDPDRVERARSWFRRWGQSSVCWGRFLPFLRSVVSIPAGVAGMSTLRFGLYTTLGTVGFFTVTGAAVYYGRQRSLFAAALAVATEHPLATTAALVAALGLATVAVLRRRARR